MSTNRNWGKSNLFSEGHRIHLPSNFCLFDVDGILLDDKRNPKFIYEGKYKKVSKNTRTLTDCCYGAHCLHIPHSLIHIFCRYF